MHEDLREEVTETAVAMIHGGFMTREEVLESVAEVHELAEDDEEVRALVAQVWDERVAEQSNWPDTTDVDRLQVVFEQLNASGIVARADFTCCGTCGAAEIGDEADENSRGYTFFHTQDTESAVHGGSLYLSYGSFAESTDPVAVGHEVVAALNNAGLTTQWDGSIRKRILVNVDWRKRLPAG